LNTFYDYLYWRGDITFDQSPLNEIDTMIFSMLSYIDFSPVFSEFNLDTRYSMVEIEKILSAAGAFNNAEKMMDFDKECLSILQIVASTKRYSAMKVFGYYEYFKISKDTQFSAISYMLEDNSIVVAFRGTDTSLVGWKEDLAMSFCTKIGSQQKGVEYLNKISKVNDEPLYIAGHSKGGNVAIYAAIKSDESIQNRIVKVFNFDGPGFNKKAVSKEEYDILGVEKIVTIIPQASVVGILLQHEEPFSIAYSSKKTGIFQHYPTTWEVDVTGFKRVEGIKNESQYFDETIHTFLDGLSEKELEFFVDTIFNSLQAGGAVTLLDLSKTRGKAFTAIRKYYLETPKETRKQVEAVLKSFFKVSREVSKKETIRQFNINREKTANLFKQTRLTELVKN
jgi:hypothetical protein